MINIILASFLAGDLAHYHFLLSHLSCEQNVKTPRSQGSGSQNCHSGLTAEARAKATLQKQTVIVLYR